MRLSESGNTQLYISHYDNESVTINQQRYSHSIIVSPDKIIPGNPSQPSDYIYKSTKTLLQSSPDIILFGTGNRSQKPPQYAIDACNEANTGFEFMNTPSACRCINLLLEEERNLIALLIIGGTT